MTQIIKIKRSSTAEEPTSLENGELAYSSVSQKLFIGDPLTGTVLQVGGTNTNITSLSNVDITDSTISNSTIEDATFSNVSINAVSISSANLTSPYIITGLELGHASDTTLTRNAAGVMAVEGNIVPSPGSQANGDILYRGSSNWQRLAKGTDGQVLSLSSGYPAWTDAASETSHSSNPFATTSGTDVTASGIPSGTKIVRVELKDISGSSSGWDLEFSIGDSGGLETSGYNGNAIESDGSSVTTTAIANPIIMNALSSLFSSTQASGVIDMRHLGSNRWEIKWHLNTQSADDTTFGYCIKTLSAELTQLNLGITAGSFDAGSYSVYYL